MTVWAIIGILFAFGFLVFYGWSTWQEYLPQWAAYKMQRENRIMELAIRRLGTEMVRTSYWYQKDIDRQFIELIGHRLESGRGYDPEDLRDEVEALEAKQV